MVLDLGEKMPHLSVAELDLIKSPATTTHHPCYLPPRHVSNSRSPPLERESYASTHRQARGRMQTMATPTGNSMTNHWPEPHVRKNVRKTTDADCSTPNTLLPLVDLAHRDREGSNQQEQLLPRQAPAVDSDGSKARTGREGCPCRPVAIRADLLVTVFLFDHLVLIFSS